MQEKGALFFLLLLTWLLQYHLFVCLAYIHVHLFDRFLKYIPFYSLIDTEIRT